jgi:hypothetical protein
MSFLADSEAKATIHFTIRLNSYTFWGWIATHFDSLYTTLVSMVVPYRSSQSQHFSLFLPRKEHCESPRLRQWQYGQELQYSTESHSAQRSHLHCSHVLTVPHSAQIAFPQLSHVVTLLHSLLHNFHNDCKRLCPDIPCSKIGLDIARCHKKR